MDRCRTDVPALLPLAGRAIGLGGAPRAAACWLQDGSAPPPPELAAPESAPDLAGSQS
jgi:peptide/nickel transport system ATP-binding protein